MFGCHNENKCGFEIWAPTPEAVENLAFSAYCKHTTELEQIIETLYKAALEGNDNVTIDTDEFLSENDWNYIRKEVQAKLNACYY